MDLQKKMMRETPLIEGTALTTMPLSTFYSFIVTSFLCPRVRSAYSYSLSDESIDIVLSNCVLNLVNQEDRLQMFKELYRVVKVRTV